MEELTKHRGRKKCSMYNVIELCVSTNLQLF